jgi:Leucine-rich repeat (LRR) protein
MGCFGRIKHSLVLVNISINEHHLTEESFEKDNLTAFGYRAEIFSHKDLKRFSAGILMLYSMNNVVTSINHQAGRFNTLIIGVPLGYTWVLWDHLTINPNISILYPLTNRTVKIGIDEVNQAPWGLEPGLRIGFRF